MFAGIWAGGVKMNYQDEVIKKNNNSPKPKGKEQKLELGPKKYCKICNTSVGHRESGVITDGKITIQSNCFFQSLANLGIVNGLNKQLNIEQTQKFIEDKFVESAIPRFSEREKTLEGLFALQEKIFGPINFAALCNKLRQKPEFAEL
jgi:ribosomal protein L33